MKKVMLLFLLITGLVSCKKYSFELTGTTQVATFRSQIVNDEFKIYTHLPDDYSVNADYPVIFLLDGDWYFEDFARELNDLILSGTVEPAILVGIGYTEKVDAKRFRDYTFQKDPEYDLATGEADNFRTFLQSELLPKIRSDFSTDSSKYVLMGHSLGGLNALYLLLQNPKSPFSGFVSISPSLWWGNGALFGLEQQKAISTTNLAAKVYLAVGQDEPPSMTILASEMIERLESRNYDQFQMDAAFFPGASHSQVPLTGFRNGILYVLN